MKWTIQNTKMIPGMKNWKRTKIYQWYLLTSFYTISYNFVYSLFLTLFQIWESIFDPFSSNQISSNFTQEYFLWKKIVFKYFRCSLWKCKIDFRTVRQIEESSQTRKNWQNRPVITKSQKRLEQKPNFEQDYAYYNKATV